MKAAVVLSGHLRGVRRCSDKMRQNLVSQYEEAKVFVHSWDETHPRTASWHKDDGDSKPLTLSEMFEAVDPVGEVVDGVVASQRPVPDFGRLHNDLDRYGQWCMWKGCYEAMSMAIAWYRAEDEPAPDIVIRARPDLLLQNPFLIEEPPATREIVCAHNESKAMDALFVMNWNTAVLLCAALENHITELLRAENFGEWLCAMLFKARKADYLYGRDWRILRQ